MLNERKLKQCAKPCTKKIKGENKNDKNEIKKDD